MADLFEDILYHLLSREDIAPLIPKRCYDDDLGRQISLLDSLQRQNVPNRTMRNQTIWEAIGDNEEVRVNFRTFFKKLILLYLLNDEPNKADIVVREMMLEKREQDDVCLWLRIMVAKRL